MSIACMWQSTLGSSCRRKADYIERSGLAIDIIDMLYGVRNGLVIWEMA